MSSCTLYQYKKLNSSSLLFSSLPQFVSYQSKSAKCPSSVHRSFSIHLLRADREIFQHWSVLSSSCTKIRERWSWKAWWSSSRARRSLLPVPLAFLLRVLTLSSYLFVCSIICCRVKNIGHQSDLVVDRNAVFVEKVLRVQPNVKKLYLLLRASDAKAATLRFQNEVCCKRPIKNKPC